MPFRLLQKLNEEYAKISYEEATEDARSVRFKCDAAMASFRRLRDALADLVPVVEQTKGLHKGISLARPIVAQYKLLIKDAYEKDQIVKEEAAARIELIDKIEQAIVESARQKQDELLKAAGKIDGIFVAAMGNIEQVKEYLVGLRQQQEFIEKNPNWFGTKEIINDSALTKTQAPTAEPPKKQRRPRKPKNGAAASTAKEAKEATESAKALEEAEPAVAETVQPPPTVAAPPVMLAGSPMMNLGGILPKVNKTS